MEGSENIEENNNVTFNEVFSAEPRVRLRSRAESRGDGNKAPLLGTILGFQRPELLSRGPPFGVQERGRFTTRDLISSFFQSIFPHVDFTYWPSLRFHLKEIGG